MELAKQFREHVLKQKAYAYVMNVVGWDSATEAPKGAFQRRAQLTGIISAESFKLRTSKEYQEVVNGLFETIETLDDELQREIKKAKKDLDQILKIPQNEYVEYGQLVGLSQRLWEEAKENDDFEMFKPNLEKLVAFQRKFANYIDKEKHPYNVMLDNFEEGMTMDEYDKFFNALRKDLVPFVKKVLNSGKVLNDAFSGLDYEQENQKEFSEYVVDVLGFNRDGGLLKESVHPFTWNTHPSDVRLTTRYLPDMVFSSIFATIHELGHALYEQQIDEKFNNTLLNGGTSMGVHESQSRFYENVLGRSKEFWATHLDKFKEVFPEQTKNVTLDDFHRAVNKVEASFIRVEADELTYPLHIMVRYEIERILMNGEITVDELPKVWNNKMVEYLGIEPKNNAEGVLQDVHWSAGLFGYFPTYALGTAYAAQFYNTMKKEFNVLEEVRNNNFDKINEWLKNKIHKFGSSKDPKELLLEVTGEEFNPKYYVDYLIEKYTELYL